MATPPPIVLALMPDLFFLSRLREAAAARGVRVEVVRRPAGLAARAAELGPALVIIDMGSAGADWGEAVRALKAEPATATVPVVAFGPHVDTASQAAARAAGADRVLSNSRFSEGLPELLARYLPASETAADANPG